MNNLKQNANLLACYSKVSDKHVFSHSSPQYSNRPVFFFHLLGYVANFGILLAPESTFWKQTARSANFGRNALIIVSPNKTKSKKGDAVSQIWDMLLIASICCRSSIWFHVLLFSLLDHWNRCQLTTYRCRVFVGQPPWVTTKPRHHPLPWRRRRFGNKNRAP